VFVGGGQAALRPSPFAPSPAPIPFSSSVGISSFFFFFVFFFLLFFPSFFLPLLLPLLLVPSPVGSLPRVYPFRGDLAAESPDEIEIKRESDRASRTSAMTNR